MIELPKRSVTRFFIPLIDVLTLMFCIFLLMPVVKPVQEESGETSSTGAKAAPDPQRWARDRQELELLRRERSQQQELKNLDQERASLQGQLEDLRNKKIEALQKRLAIRVLEIGNDGRLFAYDSLRDKDRRIAITRDNVKQFITDQQKQAGADGLYLLLLYPRPASGFPTFPLRSQREEYDLWFRGVAHGYDIR